MTRLGQTICPQRWHLRMTEEIEKARKPTMKVFSIKVTLTVALNDDAEVAPENIGNAVEQYLAAYLTVHSTKGGYRFRAAIVDSVEEVPLARPRG